MDLPPISLLLNSSQIGTHHHPFNRLVLMLDTSYSNNFKINFLIVNLQFLLFIWHMKSHSTAHTCQYFLWTIYSVFIGHWNFLFQKKTFMLDQHNSPSNIISQKFFSGLLQHDHTQKFHKYLNWYHFLWFSYLD